MYYDGPLRILKTEILSADEAEVEERFAKQVQTHLDRMVRDYEAKFGNVIDTDKAREISADYTASTESRTRWSRAVYRPAKALADEIYRRIINANDQPLRILFTSGGTGAGKSTALALMLNSQIEPEDQYDIVVDGTLSDFDAAKDKIQRALDLGHIVTIIHVHRSFAEAVRMVIKRAIAMGRAVTLDNIAVTHFRSAETLSKLAGDFGGQIGIRVVEFADQGLQRISLADLANRQAESIDDLRNRAQTVLENEFNSLKAEKPEIYAALRQRGSRL